jgi:hypothetical protein
VCLCTWYGKPAGSWEELKRKSLESGDRWFNPVGDRDGMQFICR